MSSMIALDRPVPARPAADPAPSPAPIGAPSIRRRTASKLWAGVLAVSLLMSLGGSGGLFDSGVAFALQARAAALHLRWADMIANGIPASDLATLKQEW